MSRSRPGLGRRFVAATSCALVLALSAGLGSALADDPRPLDFTHNAVNAPAPITGAVIGAGQQFSRGQAICTTATQSGNANTDCEENGPHNETSIAVDPTNAMHIIGGVNDYQLAINPGGHLTESIHSRAHVTTDGGHTWTEYPIFTNAAYQATGDPALAFDATGHAYYGTLGFRFVSPFNVQNPDVLVANSGDGGKTWNGSVIAHGSGVETSVGDLLDKEYVAAWGAGNAIVTYGDFRLLQGGAFSTARIYASVTHDFGATWSTPVLISGSLDQAFVSVPTVAADGRIFVAFMNTTDLKTGRDDYEVVEVSPQTGAALGAPVRVATVIDGFTDYPFAFGSPTYQDSVFRTWAAGNITADPTNGAHLAVVWSDMRNSTLPAPADPYVAKTNSDVIVSQSLDHGKTWSTPTALTIRNDQFMPWGAYDVNGMLRIGTFDRQYDAANHSYGYTIATETAHNSLTFTTSQVSTALSNPTTDSRWFARNVNPNFPNASAFIGDYSNIAALPSGGVVAYWTDMRETNCFAGVCRHGEDAFFGVAP